MKNETLKEFITRTVTEAFSKMTGTEIAELAKVPFEGTRG